MNRDPLQFLKELGWNSFFQEQFQLIKVPGSVSGRVVSESKGSYQVNSEYGELTARIAGEMRYQLEMKKTSQITKISFIAVA